MIILKKIIAIVLLVTMGCSLKEKKEGIHSINVFRANFYDPPSEYRSAPLWDWNENITEEGIEFQMNEFKKAGIGGVFVHPRPGLLTEYLSHDWFSLFNYTVQKGRELNIKVWIYDENSYPSGFAGGHVPAQMPDSYKHGSSLKMHIQKSGDNFPTENVEVILKKTGNKFVNITNDLENEKGKKGIYYVFEKAFPEKSLWYGGYSYVDLLYPGVTEKFMELTMLNGYERNRDDFGKTVMGIFTDEPNLEAAMGKGSLIRWTPDLWSEFEERWGYDLKINLPCLIEEIGDWKKVRHDYYEMILELFIDRWSKPWSSYCDEKNLTWTGHYWEHGWPVPTDGFDESAFYIWHQMPGVDMLGNKLDTLGMGLQFGNDRAIRELRSAANQAGRIRTLSETYGGGGWEMDFEEQKRLVDWQCALGVNFVNQHLSYYSLNGVRKFDYPPSFSYHEPWWEHYKLMGDYIGRVSLAMSSGEQINNTLVLQPNTSAWMYFSRKVKNSQINKIQSGFKKFVYQLEQKHLEYDLGSEYVLKTLGKVDGNRLIVGQRDYSLVVIPLEMENIDSSTFEMLAKYLDNGGKILSFNSNISRVDGVPTDKVNSLAEKFSDQWINIDKLNNPEAIKLLKSDAFKIDDYSQNGMLYHHRRFLEDGQLLFLVNSHKTQNAKVKICLRGKYLTKLDLLTGKEFVYPAEFENGNVKFNVELQPAGSALFVATDKKKAGLVNYNSFGSEKQLNSNRPITVKRESENILVVNYLDLKTSKTEKKDIYFMDALVSLFKENEIDMGNPWQHKIQYKKSFLELDSLFDSNTGFEVSYHFNINENLKDEAMNTIRAAIERPKLWSVVINGNIVEPMSKGYWIDKDIPLFKIGSYLEKGKNTITLRAPRMNILAEIMPIYILGDFLVTPAKKGFEISDGDISMLGSWPELGLPFYSQKVAYSQKFEIKKTKGYVYKVQVKNYNGTICEINVNGKQAGTIAWQPNELNVTDYLNDGENEITVKIIGSLKNTFGFFYHDNNYWINGPYEWNRAPKEIPNASNYFLIDYGLFEPFLLKKYHIEN